MESKSIIVFLFLCLLAISFLGFVIAVDTVTVSSSNCSKNEDCGTGQYCLKSNCDPYATGVCSIPSTVCYNLYKAVCGCDGKTYANECYAKAAKVNIKSNTACESDCKYYYWFDFNTRECGYKQFCGAYMYYGLQVFNTKDDCLKALGSVCTDSDGGIDYNVKGITKGSYGNGQKFDVEDSCENNEVHEYYCYSNANDVTKPNYGWINYKCPNGCSDGACVQSNNTQTCTDSDGGSNVYVKGEVDSIMSNDLLNHAKDECNGKNLTEFYCSGGKAVREKIVCDIGCSDGACLQNNGFCGNGICESGEGDECPGCYYKDPPCLMPCKAGTCNQDCVKPQCKSDADCPQIYCIKAPCPINKCIDGLCKITNNCQPTKCDDGTMTKCKESNGICSCSTCPPIIIKPVCGNGICESGEGEVCVRPMIQMYCEKGKECKSPPARCEVVCPQDCKPTEGIYVNLNEKFKLFVYQSAKIRENDNDVMKITFKDLIAYKCGETEVTSSNSGIIRRKVAVATGDIVAETSSESSGGSGGVATSILKCIGAGPKALLDVDINNDNNELDKHNILNLDLGEKKQIKDYTIYFIDYDYASRTGVFLVSRETFTCPNGCKCDENGKTIECPIEVCKVGYTLCSDGVCRDKCEITSSEDCKYGCMSDGKCFPMGIRSNGQFCSDNLVMSPQKKSNDKCENNFECSSNVCVSGKCISENLIQKILNWFNRMFGGKR